VSAARILLVRHGRSAHVHSGGWLDTAGIHRWRQDYDAAGIAPDDRPPGALVRETEEVGAVVSSDLPRAIASAALLAPSRQIPASELLREAPLPLPSWIPDRLVLPLLGWGAVVHVHWGYNIVSGAHPPPPERERAERAADWLATLAREHTSVLALTHGVFRQMLAARLETIGWRDGNGEENRSYRHWSVWRLTL
jgi:broad specificity phosphatase PhoE